MANPLMIKATPRGGAQGSDGVPVMRGGDRGADGSVDDSRDDGGILRARLRGGWRSPRPGAGGVGRRGAWADAA
ncbi:hypothetical protein [uncultured Actinomyces sp.]|uniref:hypothetical protein n=1 Tax=uncultured Actinomyces sp. TaxID=249061 RepID=UPI0028893A84|nr:hypothetical protein [uncultured Actinomyces sp.]